jgi:phosphatidylglycerophosphate synthase
VHSAPVTRRAWHFAADGTWLQCGRSANCMTALEWHPPNAPLRAGVLRAGVIALLVVAGSAMTARPWLQLGALYPGKAAAVFAAGMVMAFGYVGSHHPHAHFGPANHVTMIRVMIVALIASLIGEPVNPRTAAAASIAAAVMTVLDGVDGWLARRSRMASAFGARFDMETDAALVMAMSVLIWRHGKAGMWALLGGMLRYIFVIAGWRLPWMARPLRPTRRARIITVFYTLGLSVGLAPFVPVPLSAIVVGLTTAALSWSFAVDVRRLWRME